MQPREKQVSYHKRIIDVRRIFIDSLHIPFLKALQRKYRQKKAVTEFISERDEHSKSQYYKLVFIY